MAVTVAAGNTAVVYIPTEQTITFTPGSGGSISFGCSAQIGYAKPADRRIYAEEAISIPPGATMFVTAIDAPATYSDVTTTGGAGASVDGIEDVPGLPDALDAKADTNGIDELAQDAVAAMFAAGTHSGISFSYNDAGNALSATVTVEGGGTTPDPVALTSATTLNRADHGNRQINYNGNSAALTIDAEATGLWEDTDKVLVYTDAASPGYAVLITPDGKYVVGVPGYVCGAARVGVDSWNVFTTENPAAFDGMSFISLPASPIATTVTSLGMASTTIAGVVGNTVGSTYAAGFPCTARLSCTAAAVANTDAGLRQATTAAALVVPGAADTPPIRLTIVAGPNDTNGGRCAFGFADDRPAATADASAAARTNVILVGGDTADTNAYVMHKDADGAASTKTALGGGSGFPTNQAGQAWEVTIEMRGGTSRVAVVSVLNLITKVRSSTVLTTRLPTAGAAVTIFALVNTGAAALQRDMFWAGWSAGKFAPQPCAIAFVGGGGGSSSASEPAYPAADTVGRAVLAADRTIEYDDTATGAFTLAADVDQYQCLFVQANTGSITLTVPAGVTINGVDGSVTPTVTLTNVQWSTALLIRRSANNYLVA